MSRVRVLVGTRKGAFILNADGTRGRWDIQGPHFGGWEVYHMKGSPADPGRIYTSQSTAWFGQIIQRSDDGGKTWFQPGTPPGESTTTPEGFPKGESNKFVYDTSAETGKPMGDHLFYDGTSRPWEFKRVWHLEPSLANPDAVYAGVEDAALFQSLDGGTTWQELSGLRGHRSGPQWMPGAGGMCLHTIVLDPAGGQRIFVAISAAGVFRSDDAGATWRAVNAGLKSDLIPDPDAEVGHCAHHISTHPSRPEVLYLQNHWNVFRSDNSSESWRQVNGNLPSDFGYTIQVHPHEAATIYVVPISSGFEHFPPEGKLRVFRSKTGGDQWEALTRGLPQQDCYVNVLRDAMAVDSLEPAGIYFGTTGGQVYASSNGGDSWQAIARDFPPVLSVEVQTLP